MEAIELIVGPACIAVTLLMILMARPLAGEPARFLKSWPVAQGYALVALASAVAGAALLISHIPAVPALQH